MAEEKENNKEWNFSRIGKQTHKDFLKPKRKSGGCSPCDVIWSKQYPQGTNEFRLSSDPFIDPIGISIMDTIDTATHPLLENWERPFNSGPGLYGENARFNDKIYTSAVYYSSVSTVAPSSWNNWEWGIHELQLNGSCTSASVSKQMKIDFGGYNFIPRISPISHPWAEWHMQELQISTALPNGNIIGFAQVHTSTYSQQTLGLPLEWVIMEFDVSGTQALCVNAFNPPAGIGGGQWGTPPVPAQAFFGDLIYLQQHNCLLGVGGSSNSHVITFDLNGNLIDSVDMGSVFQFGFGVKAAFCHNGKVFIHHLNAPGSVPPQVSSFWEIHISPMGVPLSVSYVGSGWPGDWEGGDASSDFQCCNITPIISGCMDIDALNYDPLATADCNGVVGGNDTDCCEYPCHHPYGWEPSVLL